MGSKDYSFFQTSNWTKVLQESYGYKPAYAASIEGGRFSTLIPCVDVRSILTGRRGVSLPFTDYCESIFDDENCRHVAMTCLTDYGRMAGWKYLELRGQNSLAGEVPYFRYYCSHVLPLQKSVKDIFSGFRDSTRRNIRKAERMEVQIEISTAMESLNDFYRLHCLTRKFHGLPPQPFHFFRNIHDHVISKNMGLVVLACHKGKHIAGAVFFHFGDKVIYKYGASNRVYQELRANNLVIWEAIRWYSERGYGSLCFGKTEPGAVRLKQFKSGWGAEERIIRYYRYDPKKELFMGNCSAAEEPFYKIFNKMPIPVLKIAGSILYRHVA